MALRPPSSDGLRSFEYDEANRPSVARVFKDGEEARIRSLHNAWGQRVFKGEPEASQTLPSETTLGQSFIDWLKSNFRWMFEQAQANTSIGTAYIYDEDGSLLGEYDNGSAKAAGRTEYLWLPVENGQPIPVGILRNGNFFAIHSDHLGTPRLMTNEDNKPVWQWPYSAFGANKPTGILQATPNPRVAITNQPVLLKATAPIELNLRFPGQYFDSETNLHYNYFRSYQPNQGRYTQSDPIGLEGGLNRFGYVGGNPVSYVDPRGLDRWGAEGGRGIVYTHMDRGLTIYYDAVSGDSFEFSSRNKVAPGTRSGADGPYSGLVTYCERGKLARSFGTAKMRTTDPDLRWIHGGGSGLSDPWAPQQGWKPTEGCTRAQNEDVDQLCSEIDVFRSRYPKGVMLYRRD